MDTAARAATVHGEAPRDPRQRRLLPLRPRRHLDSQGHAAV